MEAKNTEPQSSSSTATTLNKWFSNPLPGVGDRTVPITALSSPLDYAAQPGGKKYSLSSHNTQSRGYLCSYSQLPDGCGQLHLCEDARNIPIAPHIPNDVGEGEEEEPTAEIPRGYTRSTYRSLTAVQALAVARGNLVLLVGASSPSSCRTARQTGLLTDDLNYTEAYLNRLVSDLTNLLLLGQRPTPPEFLNLNWTDRCRAVFAQNPQVFNTIALVAGTTLSLYGPIFSEIFRVRPESRDGVRRRVLECLRQLPIVDNRWDIYSALDVDAAHAPVAAVADPAPRLTANCYHIPVQEVCVSQNPTRYEQQHGRPESGLLASMRLRLQDQSATSSLGSIIRGPTIRDGTSVLSLARMTSDDAGTVMDVVPLVRLYCMLLSVDRRLYVSDPTPNHFITGSEFTLQNFTYVAPSPSPHYLVAMTLSVYTTWMSGSLPGDEIRVDDEIVFSPALVDLNWIAIPVRTAFLGNRGIIPYIAAHLDSYIWSGRVNCEYSGSNSGPNNYLPEVTTMPCANSVSITGRQNAILVLMDETSPNSPGIDCGGITVPVWGFETRPRAQQPAPPVDAFHAISERFSSPDFPVDIVWAEKEMVCQSSIYGSASIARSVAACLYPSWRPGYTVDPGKSPRLLNGAYFPGKFNARVETIPYPGTDYQQRNINSMSEEFWPMWMDSLNFGALNALHVPPTAYATPQDDDNPCRWSEVAASSPQFYASQCSSNTRLAVHMGLYQRTQDEVLHFAPHALGSWLHMQAAALSCATAHMLVETDTMASVWCGTFTGYDKLQKSTSIDSRKDAIFGGILRHVSAAEVFSGWGDVGVLDSISASYFLPRAKMVQFLTCSPVPSALTVQWAEKMGYHQLTTKMDQSAFTRAGELRFGVLIKQGASVDKVVMTSTIDMQRYCPKVTLHMSTSGSRAIFPWIYPEGYDSTVSQAQYPTTPACYLMSKTTTVAELDVDQAHLAPNYYYVEGSNVEHQIQPLRGIIFSPLIWPDPPAPRQENSSPSIVTVGGVKDVPKRADILAATAGASPGPTPVVIQQQDPMATAGPPVVAPPGHSPE